MKLSLAPPSRSFPFLLALLGLVLGGLFYLNDHLQNRATIEELRQEITHQRDDLESKDQALLRLRRDLRILQADVAAQSRRSLENPRTEAQQVSGFDPAATQFRIVDGREDLAAANSVVQNGLEEVAPDDPEITRLKTLEGIGILGDQLANRSVDLAILQLDLAAKADELGIPLQVHSMDSAVASANSVYQRYAPYFLLRDEVAQATRIVSTLRVRIEQERIELGMAASHR
jgi:hypothetical protein